MFKILSAIWFTAIVSYAFYDKGIFIALSIATFVGVPMALGWAMAKEDT